MVLTCLKRQKPISSSPPHPLRTRIFSFYVENGWYHGILFLSIVRKGQVQKIKCLEVHDNDTNVIGDEKKNTPSDSGGIGWQGKFGGGGAPLP